MVDAAHPIRRAFQDLLAEGPVLLSGALGTELERRGAPTPLPLWATAAMEARPDLVRATHARYVRAGARVVVANTFRTDRWTLAKVERRAEARDLTRRAMTLAREGVARARPNAPVLVVGSISPLEDCYRPDLVPDDTTLRLEHGVRVGDLIAAGAPAAWIETMNTIREALAALGAAEAGNLPAAVSFCVADGTHLLSGEPLADAVAAVTPYEPLAILVNCCAPPVATAALETLRDLTDLPTGVYANGRGEVDPVKGWRFRGGTGDRAYARHVGRWLDLGARLVGGCCGTTPRTIRRIARVLSARPS